MALLGWLCSVEGATLDWIDHHDLSRETMRELLVQDARRHDARHRGDGPRVPAPRSRQPPRRSGLTTRALTRAEARWSSRPDVAAVGPAS